MASISARIDFACPTDPDAPRLRRVFGAPRETLVAHHLDEVRSLINAVHRRALDGKWCVGYVRYEAAAAFDPALVTHKAKGPLAWFGIHDSAQPWQEAADADIDDGNEQILSVSPELFFDWRGRRLLTRPMKGTAEQK